MENPQWAPDREKSEIETDNLQDCLNNGGKDNNAIEESAGVQETGAQPECDNPVVSEKAQQLVSVILDQMKELSNSEKYYLYLKLFQVSNVVDPLRQPLNPLGSRSEINRTISWIKTHLEEDPETSLPKQYVYEEYSNYCLENQIKALSQADFGKVMKQVYPKVRARRLGTRGNSRYCYSGLRRRIKLKAPRLPDLADKPLSTESPCSLSSLTAAAWVIVKEWSEIHFGVQFASLQALARFLVLDHSIGTGSEAAQQLKRDSPCPTNKTPTQLQIQNKILQKTETKERKRKAQCQQKEQSKKIKPRAEVEIPSLASESSTSTGASSTSASPTQGKPICDKSPDFTELPALPDFKSFQMPVSEQPPQNGAAKVAIPRLSAGAKGPRRSPQKQVKNAKYKNIQPKPQPCDIASYNPQTPAVPRSQVVQHNVDRFKEVKSDDEVEAEAEAAALPLPRERLDSISNVDKDAMDEYLGTNNSQHEEELSKYFNGNIEPSDPDNSTKILKLRQLLEQHGISDNKISSFPPDSLPAPEIPQRTFPNPTSARRRVSFEEVPQSPNTRRKNFSFTPISPGPQSPKCSSTNVSPFVSPRNTPVLRVGKHLVVRKTKKENDLTVDIPDSRKFNVVMSAPASPMLRPNLVTSNKSVLHKLLQSNSKVSYNPNYMKNYSEIKRDIEDLLTAEKDSLDNLTDLTYRSQSVPLNQMIKSNFDEATFLTTEQTPTTNDFNDYEDPVVETASVKRIIDALDEQRCEENNEIEIYNNLNQTLPGFNLITNNNLGIQANYNNINNYTPCARSLNRSQSIDFVSCYNKSNNPSRSVPNTPLSFELLNKAAVKDFSQNSRSYPTTPLVVNDETFNYTLNGDCLLNGQPIRNHNAADLTCFMSSEEEFRNLSGNDFGIVVDGCFVWCNSGRKCVCEIENKIVTRLSVITNIVLFWKMMALTLF